jgi:UDP-glucose 4-epimerase
MGLRLDGPAGSIRRVLFLESELAHPAHRRRRLSSPRTRSLFWHPSGRGVVLYDNFCNSDRSVLDRLHQITGRSTSFVEGDIRDTQCLADTLRQHQCTSVIHFAGLKAVGESVQKPIDYYANNVQGTVSLLQAMQQTGVKTLVFSSSATVYGSPQVSAAGRVAPHVGHQPLRAQQASD